MGGGDDDMNTTERSDFDDEDKIFYNKIGKTEIQIDKILSNLLVSDVSVNHSKLNVLWYRNTKLLGM